VKYKSDDMYVGRSKKKKEEESVVKPIVRRQLCRAA